MDGTQILTASRNKLNLHQWPEDFAALLASSTLREMPVPGIVRWLELMPSPDWMCRAEVMLPQLHKLMDNPDFDVHFVMLSEYLEAARAIAEPRRYTMDDVFHGMSIGKNGDLFRRLSRTSEQSALAAESLAALLGFFRRLYAQWDVYPTWVLEQAWRELLAAQHHDNDKCEGLCGHIGLRSYERSLAITDHIQTQLCAYWPGARPAPRGGSSSSIRSAGGAPTSRPTQRPALCASSRMCRPWATSC